MKYMSPEQFQFPTHGTERQKNKHYEQIIQLLLPYAERYYQNSSDSHDLLQRLVMKIHGNYEYWQALSNPKPFLIASLHNLFIDDVRKMKKTKKLCVLMDDSAWERYDDSSWLQVVAETNEGVETNLAESRFALISSRIATMSPNTQAFIKLYYLEEKSFKEIAAILGIPYESVKTISKRFKAKFADLQSERKSDIRGSRARPKAGDS